VLIERHRFISTNFFYFCTMTFLQNRRILWAGLFQSVFVFFILFAAYSESIAPIRVKTDSKTLLCISSGSSVVVREASEHISAPLSLLNHHGLLEKSWLCAEWIRSSAWFTNTALRISSRIYNTFYFVTTIHAP
jgi:hypothetical protein